MSVTQTLINPTADLLINIERMGGRVVESTDSKVKVQISQDWLVDFDNDDQISAIRIDFKLPPVDDPVLFLGVARNTIGIAVYSEPAKDTRFIPYCSLVEAANEPQVGDRVEISYPNSAKTKLGTITHVRPDYFNNGYAYAKIKLDGSQHFALVPFEDFTILNPRTIFDMVSVIN